MTSGAAFQRRAAVAATTVMCITTFLGFSALAIDLGMLYNVKGELQRAADAGAMAGVATSTLGRLGSLLVLLVTAL